MAVKRLILCIVLQAGWVVVSVASAQDDLGTSSQISNLGLQESVSVMPSIWRIIGSFVLVVAVGLVLMWGIKRLIPTVGAGANQSDVKITVLARQPIVRGPTLHVVDISGTRFAITDSRHGVSMTKLPAARSESSPDEDTE